MAPGPYQFSEAGMAVGFGGNTLANQQQSGAETEEEKRRRLAAIQAAQTRMGVGNDYAAALSPASAALGFGGGFSGVKSGGRYGGQANDGARN